MFSRFLPLAVHRREVPVSSLKTAVILAITLGLFGVTAAPQAGGLTPELLWSLTRLSDPQPSSDGSVIAYVARSYDVESNGSTSSLWVVPARGGEPRRLTSAAVHDGSPRWLPHSSILLFTSDRDESSALWALDSEGGEPWQISHLPLDMGGFVLAGNRVVFTLDVAPGRVFEGTVRSVGFGVDAGSTMNPGGLPSIKGSQGWLRDPQRFPVIIGLNDDQATGLRRIGGQADVVVYTDGNFLFNSIAWFHLRVRSLLSYVR